MVRRRALKPRTAASLRKYGLTVEEWQAMLEKQGGVCFICKRGGKVRHLSVDHDHRIAAATGKIIVRGLICSKCNHRGLGAFEWDDDVLKRAIKYMQRILRLRAQHLPGIVSDNRSDEEGNIA